MNAIELLPESLDCSDPIDQLQVWYAAAELETANADVVALATASADAVPSVRMVKFKGFTANERGVNLSFYSNYESRKGRELQENPRATMLFYWPTMRRQVQVEGECRRMSSRDSQAYFASREREVQLSTLMSQQSRELSSFALIDARVAELRREFAGREITCPSYWGGYLLCPTRIEFRIGREHRRHWRWEFSRTDSQWACRKLYP